MELVRRWMPLLFLAGLVVYSHRILAARAAQNPWFGSAARRRWLLHGEIAAAALLLISLALGISNGFTLPPYLTLWAMAAAMIWSGFALFAGLSVRIHSHALENPERRRLLMMAAPVVAVAPVLVVAAGVRGAKSDPRMRTVDVAIPGLPKDLEGLRIAQLSDIHFGPFFGRAELSRAVAMANETKPHIAVVTGDLITRRGDDLESCLRILQGLRADAPLVGCMGNHEIYAHAQDAAQQMGDAMGMRFLRENAELLRFGNAQLNIAGVDYQRMDEPYLAGTGALRKEGVVNLLLSHNPDVFDRAAELGFDLTLSGHTHGGQVTVEILDSQVNLARFFTPYVLGLYRKGNKAIYVNAGLGTVGAPIRLGAPPEVTLIRLCAA